MIERQVAGLIEERLALYVAGALSGPRQCGKTPLPPIGASRRFLLCRVQEAIEDGDRVVCDLPVLLAHLQQAP